MQSDTPNAGSEQRPLEQDPICERCEKPGSLCFCSEIRPVSVQTRFLILQHPQERKKPLATARLASLAVPGTVVRVGLSWRSLGHALGKEADPREWAVLYLGALKDTKKLLDVPFQILPKGNEKHPPRYIKGLVLLDGNWKQSKTLWWRNAWLLKLHRAVLRPEGPSLYGSARKAPRREMLSTIESMAESLVALEGAERAAGELRAVFRKHLQKVSGARSC